MVGVQPLKRKISKDVKCFPTTTSDPLRTRLRGCLKISTVVCLGRAIDPTPRRPHSLRLPRTPAHGLPKGGVLRGHQRQETQQSWRAENSSQQAGVLSSVVWSRLGLVWEHCPNHRKLVHNSRNHVPKATLKAPLNQRHTQHKSAPSQPQDNPTASPTAAWMSALRFT